MYDMIAYLEGYEAAKAGKPASACPYDPRMIQWTDWHEGYSDGGGEQRVNDKTL